MAYDKERQAHLDYKYKDDPREYKENEQLEPIEEVELNLKNALMQLNLGYTSSTRLIIQDTLEIIRKKL